MSDRLTDPASLHAAVTQALADQPITDLHTHCFTPAFGHSADGTGKGLLLWGIDELVTYHYLVSEVYRVVPASVLPYERFWAMSKSAQADHIWRHLFVERTPISEACRGVLTTLTRLGLDPNEKTLEPYRQWFAQQDASAYIDRVMELANVDSITMTNEVFSDHERSLWLANPGVGDDPRFAGVVRVDMLLRDWPEAAKRLQAWGYEVEPGLGGDSVEEARRFLRDWIARTRAIYVAMSLPPTFRYPAEPTADGDLNGAERVLEQVILPVCAEQGIPLALMIGSRPRVNPSLREGGDIGGRADVLSVVHLCAGFPQNRFLVTMLSRENQHELCVAARKFGNLMIFGCWWFLNNPSLIEEITRMRLELLGTSFCPQHSDARVLDQLIYKWDHSRTILARVLSDKYADLQAAGYRLSESQIRRDVRLLMRDNFRTFCAGGAGEAVSSSESRVSS